MTSFIIEKQKIIDNTEIIKSYSNNKIVYAVLKDNAYGLGIDMMAKILIEQGISNFAVTEYMNAIKLRNISRDIEILILNPIYNEDEILDLIINDITLTISSMKQAKMIDRLCTANNLLVNAHIEVDTGMGRFGFLDNEFEDIIKIYNDFLNISITGLFSHIYNVTSSKNTRIQYLKFKKVISDLELRNIQPGTTHFASSIALFKYPDMLFDAVRIGSAFSGRLITKEKYNLKKVGYIESKISDIRCLPKGHNIGYGNVYKTKRRTKVAIISTGYLHGFCTEKARDTFRFVDMLRYIFCDIKNYLFHKQFLVNLNGVMAPVLGRIGTNYIIIDVNNVKCSVGDTVIMDANPIHCKSVSNVVYR